MLMLCALCCAALSQVARALEGAEQYKDALRERGVSVLPVILSQDDAQERLRRLKIELSGCGCRWGGCLWGWLQGRQAGGWVGAWAVRWAGGGGGGLQADGGQLA